MPRKQEDHKKIREIFASNLRAERARQDLTQSEVARRAKLPLTTVSNAERGIGSAGIDTLAHLCDALSLPYSEILVDHGDKKAAERRAQGSKR